VAASSLAERVASSCETPVEVRQRKTCWVEINTAGASLTELLTTLEQWLGQSDLQTLRLRLAGRTYVLESSTRRGLSSGS
jgi:hypothetical protein